MKVYIKIALGLSAWGVIFWYFGGVWLDDKRLETCLNEVQKTTPNQDIIKERCIQSAQKFEENGEYGSATWFYLLGGEISKNIEELEGKIDDNFTINIGHSYLLEGDLQKAKDFYADFLWFTQGSFVENNASMDDDFTILSRLYPHQLERIKEGRNIWNKLYAPLGKIVETQQQYEELEYDYGEENSSKILQTLLQLSEPYKNRAEINYWSNLKALAERYYYSEKYTQAIETYQKLLKEQNLSTGEHVEGEIDDIISSAYMRMAELYEKHKFYNDAYTFAHKALLYKQKYQSDNRDALSQSHSRLATIFLAQSRYKKALNESLKAVSLEKEILFANRDIDTDIILSALNEEYQQLVESYQGLQEYNNAIEAYGQYINFLENEYMNGFTVFLGNAYVQQGDYLFNSDNTNSARYYKKAIELLKKSLEDAWYIEERRTYLNLLFEYSEHLKQTTDSGYLEEMNKLASFIVKIFPEEDDESLYLNALSNEKMYDIYKNINQKKSTTYHKKAIDQMSRVMRKTKKSHTKEEYEYFFKEISKELQESESNLTTQKS